MSLLIHLPLTKDLRNQGLINWTPTLDSGTTATFESGKLGQALGTGGITMPASVTKQVLNNKAFSFACWIYVKGTTGSTSERERIFGNGGMSELGGRQFSLFQYPTCNDLHWSWQNYKNGSYSGAWTSVLRGVLPSNTWTHLVVTYKKGDNTTFYINGEVKYTGTYTSDADTFEFNTKLIWNSAYHRLNDVRLYDHCLSPIEVKKISQGLVLHYPLSRGGWGQENLVVGSNTNSTSTNKWLGHSAIGGNTSTIEIDETGTPCVKVTRDNVAQSSWDYLSYDNFLRGNIKTNTTYTISFDCKPSVDGTISFTGFVNGNATNYMTNSRTTIQGNCSANKWNHMVYRCTTINSFADISTTGQVVYFSRSASLRGTNVTVLFKNIKVEEGSIATPWCPNSSDALATTMGLNDNIEYDISGFRNNGTRTGTFTYSSDTPKYQVSTKFSDGSYIKYKGPESMYQATYAFWVKSDSYTAYNMIHGPLGSPSAGTSPWLSANTESCGAWAYFGNNSPNYTRASGTISTDVWHHLVYVWDNGVARWYVDGVPSGNAVTYTTRTFIQNTAESSIGDSYTGTSWSGTPFTGQLSDFRIYATALSPEDVLSLYQASAYIDS